MRVATFDLGTNTFRVLLADVNSRNREVVKSNRSPLDLSTSRPLDLTVIRVLREITRLGQDLHKRATFHPDAVKRSLAALDRFDREIRRHQVDWAGGICTAAFRTAKNGPELLRRIRSRYGWDVRIVSAKQEATYAMRGILYGLDLRDNGTPGHRNSGKKSMSRRHAVPLSRLLVIDIGGGSTEFIVYDGQVRGIQTTPLGVVRLTESYLHHDPPLPSEMEHLNTAIDKELVPVRKKLLQPFTLHPSPFTFFVGTAGTVTTLAALKKKMRRYDPKKISGTRLTRRDLETLMQRLIAVPAKSRLKFPGMEKGREDLILAGLAILLRCMDRFDLPALTVSDSGILEGIALSHTRRRLKPAATRRVEPPGRRGL